MVRAPHHKCGECHAVQVSSLLNGERGRRGDAGLHTADITSYVSPCPVALGHGVSAQQGALKVAHSDTLGRLGPAHSTIYLI